MFFKTTILAKVVTVQSNKHRYLIWYFVKPKLRKTKIVFLMSVFWMYIKTMEIVKNCFMINK